MTEKKTKVLPVETADVKLGVRRVLKPDAWGNKYAACGNCGCRIVNVEERVPYSRILFKDRGGPFPFRVTLHFDPSEDPYKTDFHVELSAELNLMMQMLLGSRLQEAMDKLVDGLVDASNGRMPEGFDPSKFGFHV